MTVQPQIKPAGASLGKVESEARIVQATWTPLTDATKGKVHISIFFVEATREP